MSSCNICSSQMTEVAKSTRDVYLKCQSCGFWKTLTLSGEDIYADYSDFSMIKSSFESDRNRFVEQAEKILLHKFKYSGFEPSHGKRLLDVGCSEGYYVEAANNLGLESWGIDVDSANNKQCKKIGLNVVNLEEISALEGMKFDFIMIRHVIEHLPFFIEILNFYKSLLHAEGTLVIETPNQNGLLIRLTRNKLKNDRFLRHLYPPSHVNGFEQLTYKYLAKKIDLRVVKVETYSQSSLNWVLGNYTGGYIKSILHDMTSMLGMGENIICVLRH